LWIRYIEIHDNFPIQKTLRFIHVFACVCRTVIGQNNSDSTCNQTLDSVVVKSTNERIIFLGSRQRTFIFGGRKSKLIDIKNRELALTDKYARQIFVQIPSLFVYEMDGTGNQLNISTRGFDPHCF